MSEQQVTDETENDVAIRDEFPVWMHEFELGDDGARQGRWNGVAQIAGDADWNDIETLVRLAFKSVGRARPALATVQEIVETFREADPERPVDGNGREIEVLAAACLVELIENNDDDTQAAMTALAVSTASMCGARRPKLPMDLAAIAAKGLAELSEANSSRPDLEHYASSAAPTLSFDSAAARYQATPNADGFAAAMKAAAEATRAAILGVMRNQQGALRAAATFIAQQDEELQMLWWLVGERSWEFSCPFKKVDANARAIVFAKELADQTKILPGPISIRGLLSRAGVGEGASSVQKVVMTAEQTMSDWLGTLVGDEEPSPATLPMHVAIKRQLETGRGDGWVQVWAGATGVPQDFSCSELALAEQFYRERLIIDALRG